jgi:uncharacterized membrane protein
MEDHVDDMLVTENGTRAQILKPALNKAKGNAQPYKSNFACSVTINRPAADLYAFWRNFANLPRFMENIERVRQLDDGRSHWVVRSPDGTAEWDSEVMEDVPGRRIAWASVEGADVDNAGVIDFRPSTKGRGTEVRAFVSFHAPMGEAGRIIAAMMHKDPHIQAKRDLRRFKQLMETGEIAVSPAN